MSGLAAVILLLVVLSKLSNIEVTLNRIYPPPLEENKSEDTK